jgi:hypothetical protein
VVWLSASTGRPTGLGAVIDGDLAGSTANAPAGSGDAPVGLGPPVPLRRFEESFRRASRALATAAAFGITGVVELGELGVRPAILADGELGDELKRRYLDPLMDGSDIAQTLVETTRRYLENGIRPATATWTPTQSRRAPCARSGGAVVTAPASGRRRRWPGARASATVTRTSGPVPLSAWRTTSQGDPPGAANGGKDRVAENRTR